MTMKDCGARAYLKIIKCARDEHVMLIGGHHMIPKGTSFVLSKKEELSEVVSQPPCQEKTVLQCRRPLGVPCRSL